MIDLAILQASTLLEFEVDQSKSLRLRMLLVYLHGISNLIDNYEEFIDDLINDIDDYDVYDNDDFNDDLEEE